MHGAYIAYILMDAYEGDHTLNVGPIYACTYSDSRDDENSNQMLDRVLPSCPHVFVVI